MKVSPLTVTTAMALEAMPNNVLAAGNNGITGFGSIAKDSMAYQPFLDAVLIREDGRPCDPESLGEALDFVIGQRVLNGTFN